eukprot:6605403-Lingulodinium_polyedra.AAC.1
MARAGRGIVRERAEAMQRVEAKAAELQGQRREWTARLRPRVARVIGHLHLPLLDWLVRESGHGDVDYMRTLMNGRNVVGDIGRSFVYPAEDNPSQITVG